MPSKKTKLDSDLVAQRNLMKLLQWSQTVSENHKITANGPDEIRTHDLSIISRTLQPS